jgi:YD repeat-containing protein
MPDIFSQIGTKIGTELKSLSDRIDGIGGDSPSDNYSEPIFTSGLLTALTTWTDSGKGTKVGGKTFTYTSGNLTSVVEKDGSDVTTLTKTLTYDGDGNLASITKDYA